MLFLSYTIISNYSTSKVQEEERKLTMGNLNKPITSEVAIENVEKESPTIPNTGGVPIQVS